MQNFGSQFPLNSFPILKNLGNKAKNLVNKLNPNQEQNQNNVQDAPTKNTPNQSLSNTNSNININQQTNTSPAVTQHALNASNNPTNMQGTQDVKTNINKDSKQAPDQLNFGGAKDLPSYAGIANMSMKSWVANQTDHGFSTFEGGEKELRATLDGIKGFESQNYEGGGDDGSSNQGNSNKKRALLILSHIFGEMHTAQDKETGFLSNLGHFRKLGSNPQGENLLEANQGEKNAPPVPKDIQSLENLTLENVKYMKDILALPSAFPEAIRLFAKEGVLLNPKEIKEFLENRFALAQTQLFDGDPRVSERIAEFISILGNETSMLLPFVLLYYPLPLPYLDRRMDFNSAWERKDKAKEGLIASCEIYYFSRYLGRFLIKLELNKDEEFSFDIQTDEENSGYVTLLEESIAESMFLLESPPKLSELNILLTKEIYEATDSEEELAIVSNGPLRVEIALGVYAVLIVLNRISQELINPSGVIEID